MCNKKIIVLMFVLLLYSSLTSAVVHVVWQEAESMRDTGKWSNDPQHIDIMGSPYLLATGAGKTVRDAVTDLTIPEDGVYSLWVRCRDWFPSHSPGRFRVLIDDKASKVEFGQANDDTWRWVNGGKFDLKKGSAELRLHDMTGWWGRCDAVVLATSGFQPSNKKKVLAAQRLKYAGISPDIAHVGAYDLVVVGGGPAGMGAAVAAARNGIKVTLIQDRPILGGNSSTEIEIPPMGYIGSPPDRRNITGITAELFPTQGCFADSEKMERIVRAEEKISLFLNTRAIDVEMDGKNKIASVLALDVRTGKRMRFTAPLFADTTGHGWIGYYAGADYSMGQEARAEFDESLAPSKRVLVPWATVSIKRFLLLVMSRSRLTVPSGLINGHRHPTSSRWDRIDARKISSARKTSIVPAAARAAIPVMISTGPFSMPGGSNMAA